MKQLTSTIIALIPPGSMLASIQRYQDSIFRKMKNPSAIGILPVLPICGCSRCVDPPEELRLDEALNFSHPRVHKGNWYLPLINTEAVRSLQKKFSPAHRLREDHENLLFPVFPGIFLCREGAANLPSEDFPEQDRLRSASFSVALIEYRCTGPRDKWWESIEETVHWEHTVRKPAANTSHPALRSMQ
ncbi:hypothetical protein [Marispirochaeta sp.]|jgi:hypothetical protein|uniref:hypothetical protein n=1 Tax=Marispirochaeta sp. TaxID=2038653 RepID=UPI0029C91D00|nr:hypothetical protein [Marispirochaeta sp.]